MIKFLDRTLEELLAKEVPSLNAENIFFDPPDKDFTPSGIAANLFLYDIRENRNLRNTEWQMKRDGRTAVRQAPPVRVDCSYLITAWAGDVYEEHLILGQVMEALLRYPTLPLALLHEKLTGQDLPLPTATLQAGRLQSVGEFWQALDGKPKAALHYTVTIAVQPFEPVDVGLVLQSVTDIDEVPEENEGIP